ncbi:hypothetical protein [Clostridium sp. JNZ J1-5]
MIKNESINNLISEICIVSENKNELYSILIPLILSRKFFKNSKEKKDFVENVLGLIVADYAYRSKTILVGKIVSSINVLEIQEAVSINNKVNKFILDVSKANKIAKQDLEVSKATKGGKKKEASFFSNWNTYINESPRNKK